jgi:hypothetical protein
MNLGAPVITSHRYAYFRVQYNPRYHKDTSVDMNRRDDLQIWKMALEELNKQFRTAEHGTLTDLCFSSEASKLLS